MKDQVTKFDINAAFKALEDIEYPVVKGLKANKINLKETFSRKQNTEVLLEDYYDVNDTDDLAAAKEDRSDEVAKAKLARIEKIVDLDAETEEDILPSYVGKFIIQCPQCMQLFYKDEADINTSEEDSETVNVGEACPNCNNTQGFDLIGKVGEVGADEMSNYTEEDNDLNLDFEEPAEEAPEEATEEQPAEENNEEDLSLEEVPTEEEEKKEESFNRPAGESLRESIESDLGLKHSLKELKHMLDSLMFDDYYQALDDAGLADDLIFDLEDDGFDTVMVTPFWDSTGRTEYSYDEACQVYGKDIVDNQLKIIDKYYDTLCNIIGGCNEGLNESKEIFDIYDGTGSHLEREKGKQYLEKEDMLIRIARANPEKEYHYHTNDDDFKINMHARKIEIPSNIKIIKESLKESADSDLNAKLKAHDEYIKYLQAQIKSKEAALKSEKNDSIKQSIQKEIDGLNADLEAALPDALKGDMPVSNDLPDADEVPEEAIEGEEVKESLKEAKSKKFPDPDKNNLVATYKDVKIYDCTCGKYVAKINGKKVKKDSIKELKKCIDGECNESLKESQSQEIGSAYERLSKKYGVDFEDLVYGPDGFMNNNYPNGFPDFAGDVYYSRKYWDELVDWAKQARGIDLSESLKEAKYDDYDDYDDDEEKLSDYEEDNWSMDDTSVAGEMYDYLFGSDRKYLKTASGNAQFRFGKYSPYDYASGNDWIGVRANNEADLEAAKQIAQLFKREFEVVQDKYVRSQPWCIRIYLEPTDYDTVKRDELDLDPNVQITAKSVKGSSEPFSDDEMEKESLNRESFVESCLREENELLPDEISDADIDKLFDSKEFNTPISDEEVEEIIDSSNVNEDFDINDVEDIDEKSLDEHLSKYFTEVYSNVKNFKTTGCQAENNRVVIEGKINFKSGKSKSTKFNLSIKEGCKNKAVVLRGYNANKSGKFIVEAVNKKSGLKVNNIKYRCKVNEDLVEGYTRKK